MSTVVHCRKRWTFHPFNQSIIHHIHLSPALTVRRDSAQFVSNNAWVDLVKLAVRSHLSLAPLIALRGEGARRVPALVAVLTPQTDMPHLRNSHTRYICTHIINSTLYGDRERNTITLSSPTFLLLSGIKPSPLNDICSCNMYMCIYLYAYL